MGGTMVTIAYITMSIAIFLLCWFLFSPEAKDLVENSWKEYEENYEPTIWQPPTLVENVIGSVNDWEILAYYTPKVFNWLQGKVELSEVDKATCQQLRKRLETSCQWKDKNNQTHTGVRTLVYEAIRIMNNTNDKTFIISWKDDEVIAGTWIDFGAHSEYIRVEDSK